MLTTILTLLGPFATPLGEIALSVVGWFIGRSQNNAAAMGRFLDLVQQMEADKSIPGGLHAKYAAQVDANAQKAAQEYAKENPPKPGP